MCSKFTRKQIPFAKLRESQSFLSRPRGDEVEKVKESNEGDTA